MRKSRPRSSRGSFLDCSATGQVASQTTRGDPFRVEKGNKIFYVEK